MAFRNTKEVKKPKAAKKAKKSSKWSEILGGDILAAGFFSHHWKLFALIMFLIIIYVQNRYAYQQQIIELDRLKKELTDIKYDALTRSSQLMERSRQSKIEEYIQRENSELEIATAPPFLIK